MSKADPLEKAIEGAVCDHAKQLGCLVYKFTSPSRRSVPDRLFILPDNKGVFFIEFKRLGCEPTKAQAIEIAKIRAKGTRVFVIDNKDAGRALILDMLHTPGTNDLPFSKLVAKPSLSMLENENHRVVTMKDPAFN